jgi:hypothetical protein
MNKETLDLHPPAMTDSDWRKLREVVGKNLQGDALAMDLVMQQMVLTMQRAAVLVVIEIDE